MLVTLYKMSEIYKISAKLNYRIITKSAVAHTGNEFTLFVSKSTYLNT